MVVSTGREVGLSQVLWPRWPNGGSLLEGQVARGHHLVSEQHLQTRREPSGDWVPWVAPSLSEAAVLSEGPCPRTLLPVTRGLCGQTQQRCLQATSGGSLGRRKFGSLGLSRGCDPALSGSAWAGERGGQSPAPRLALAGLRCPTPSQTQSVSSAGLAHPSVPPCLSAGRGDTGSQASMRSRPETTSPTRLGGGGRGAAAGP